MADRGPRVFNIAPDKPFLAVLADAVMAGFPLDPPEPPTPLALSRWTILLPTRRAVRELERLFFERSGGKGLYLPTIKPIGDIDETTLPRSDDDIAAALPDAITPSGQLLVLIDLIDEWARESPQTRLAQEIAAAPHQAHALALSLRDFLDNLETEGIDANRITGLYDLESARHREAILEFLAIARQRYPARLAEYKLHSPATRRAMILRHEAQRLAHDQPRLPIIAAGSTGSIPATRELLKAIAQLPNGAVVLPGLDSAMDEPSWQSVGPPHPQHALKDLVAALGVARSDVHYLAGGEAGSRALLGSELMRPAETSDAWQRVVADEATTIAEAMMGVELVETRHVQDEATVIALMLRSALETPGKTASLVTPDRALARRVRAELLRWDIFIDDSGGEPLLRSANAALLHLLIDAIAEGFSPESLAGLLRHGLCCFGRTPDQARHFTSIIELAALRSEPPLSRLENLATLLRQQSTGTGRKHAAMRRLPAEDWDDAIAYAADVVATLAPLRGTAATTLAGHTAELVTACVAMAGEAFWAGEAGEALRQALEDCQRESHYLAACDGRRAAAILHQWLQSVALRPHNPRRSRLSILGLLEARLMRPDLVVMGGLNESTWPGIPDAGPWLNRPMRSVLEMQQPERAIGQTAHDFVQAFGANEVKLVWSRRLDDAPAIPSRWILRLQMLLKATGQSHRLGAPNPWQALAQRLAEPAQVTPQGKPAPRPPASARPRQLSVTQIETLIRDPYAIYGRNILGLEPLDDIAAAPDPSRLGTLVHAAIGDFLAACPLVLPQDAVAQLIAAGEKHFALLGDHPDVTSFWWPRFQRIAQWLIEDEQAKRPGIRKVHAEISGRLELDIGGTPFTLTCRADRIDELTSGLARIVDYKTGSTPSGTQVMLGLNPQLTLQAAILEAGGFVQVPPSASGEVAYIKLGGGDPAGEYKGPALKDDVMTVAHTHLANLVVLLEKYQNATQAYLPRNMVEMEDEARDYDHLSRFREWALAGPRR